jgi:hypothetical protein
MVELQAFEFLRACYPGSFYEANPGADLDYIYIAPSFEPEVEAWLVEKEIACRFTDHPPAGPISGKTVMPRPKIAFDTTADATLFKMTWGGR